MHYPGMLGGVCIYWSISDLDAPQYQPTEDPNFIARYGGDSPYRSKYIGTQTPFSAGFKKNLARSSYARARSRELRPARC